VPALWGDRVQTAGERALGARDRLVPGGDQVPDGQVPPGRVAHHVSERSPQRSEVTFGRRRIFMSACAVVGLLSGSTCHCHQQAGRDAAAQEHSHARPPDRAYLTGNDV
jgi:hypothetical protein